MPIENTDVKQESSSSEAKQDVKPTFDSTANAMIEALSKGSSPEEEKTEESVVLEKNTTEKEEPKIESTEVEPDDKVKKEQEETEKEEKSEEVEEESDSKAKEEQSSDAKHEETIPYTRFKEVNERAQRYETLAKDQEQLITFCQQNNIPPDQFRGTLEILSLANTNPLEAIKRTESFLEQLKVSAGTGLPADLAKEVNDAKKEFEDGNMSKERLAIVESRMKELAKARVQHSNLERQNQQSLLQQQQSQQQELIGGLSAWAQAKSKLDPAFKPKGKPTDKDGKFEWFIRFQDSNWARSTPRNAAEAVALADKSLAEVDEMLYQNRPVPKAKKAPLSTGHSRSTESEQPRSMDDVVNRVAKKHGYSV